jgi:serine/threonine protein kinase
MPLLEPGRQVGGWTAVRFIDEGGNGEVWEVNDADRGAAALKILRDHRANSVGYRRFRREIETVQGLGERAGVLPVLEAHLPEEPSRRDRPWYVMPLAVPLDEVLDGKPVAEVVEAIAMLAEVLADLHAQGLGHRDIKPANLLWHVGSPVLGDFGLVYIPDAESLTEPGRVPGAFGYIADEVMQDPDNAAAAPADVFALAKVLWKLLTPTALFPPQGALRADGGPSTLARSLTVPRADTLDRILEAATRPVETRIGMGELTSELRAWLALPEPAGLPEGLDVALIAARRSMDDAVRERHLGAVREQAASELEQLLVDRSADLFEAVRSLDPAGAQIGPMAVGSLHQLIEQLPETGRPLYGAPFHHGARITRAVGLGEDVLVVAFCLQVADDGQGAITGLLLAGDEETTDSTFRHLPTLRATLGVDLEAAIEATVLQAGRELGPVLEAFAQRAATDR